MRRQTRAAGTKKRSKQLHPSGKKRYQPPRLVVYGDLNDLTRGSAGPARDGGQGSPKSKPAGGA
jgi:hypothetical protein